MKRIKAIYDEMDDFINLLKSRVLIKIELPLKIEKNPILLLFSLHENIKSIREKINV